METYKKTTIEEILREEGIKRKGAWKTKTTAGIKDGRNKDGEKQYEKQEWLREESNRSSSNSTTLFWQRSINSSSNHSRKSHSPAYAAAHRFRDRRRYGYQADK